MPLRFVSLLITLVLVACDNGNLGSKACVLPSDCGAHEVCDRGVCRPTICGDGVREGNEACEDGNTVDESHCLYGTARCTGCAADCTRVLKLTGSVCGDGVVDDPHEQCDDAGLTPACTGNCRYANKSQLAAGLAHTCVVAAGALKCWGRESHGELGNGGENQNQAAPGAVTGLDSGVAAVTGGWAHTCALLASGAVKCWGYDFNGELGDGESGHSTDKVEPVDVLDLPGEAVAIRAGSAHTCALIKSGAVYCWGSDSHGQLGDGDGISDSSTPVQVSGLTSGVANITAGIEHTCALSDGGSVQCWGSNSRGQLGDGGDQTDSATPVQVSGLTEGAVAVVAGHHHTCALLDTGGVQCWGGDSDGQLGDGGDDTGSSVPVNVSGLSDGVAAIGAGYNVTCAILTTGALQCWGADESGQLGDGGDNTARSTPVAVFGLDRDVVAVAGGWRHTCALMADGCVKCWGDNYFGALGDGLADGDQTTPGYVLGLTDAKEIVAGESHTCIFSHVGSQCWGADDFGQLADGEERFMQPTPKVVSGLAGGLKGLAAGDKHTCALSAATGVKCWGADFFGQLGDGGDNLDRDTPVQATDLTSGVVAIAAGGSHSCAILDGGAAQCWGAGFDGQLGDGGSGPTHHASTPVEVTGFVDGVTAIAAGDRHTCAIRSGGAWCWGSDYAGQLGDSVEIADQTLPAPVFGLGSGVVAITAGAGHTCALLADDLVRCWGSDFAGQLGDGGQDVDQPLPVAVSNLGRVGQVAAGGFHTCVIIALSGAVKCWGLGSNGQIGDGGYADQPTPVAVVGLDSDVTSLAAGWAHTCAVVDPGDVLCWGNDSSGQLGDGPNWETTPVCAFGL